MCNEGTAGMLTLRGGLVFVGLPLATVSSTVAAQSERSPADVKTVEWGEPVGPKSDRL